MSGGVAAQPLLLALVRRGVHAFAPHAEILLPQLSAAEGAALFARSLLQK
jgi:hypothetical protein